MKRNLTKTLFVIIVFALFSPNVLIAKGKGNNTWYLTPRVGVATMLNEVGPGFATLESDFQHGMGFSGDLSLSRTIGKHFELGLGIGFYNLSSTDDSVMVHDLAAFKEGRQPAFNIYSYPTIPIEYKTTAMVPNLFLRYYIKRFTSSSRDHQLFQPYLELSAGLNFYSPELTYTDTSYMVNSKLEQFPSVWNPIPNSEDNTETYEPPYQSTEQALQFSLGIGSKFALTNGLTLNLAAEISGVSTEYLDGTPNPIADEVSSGLVARVLLGVAIPIHSGKGSRKGGEYLPWAP